MECDTATLKKELCSIQKDEMVRRMKATGSAALTYTMGTDFAREEIPFLLAVYFPYLTSLGFGVRHGGTPNECDCMGLCQHLNEGYYTVYLK
jgi:hypothetical protein